MTERESGLTKTDAPRGDDVREWELFLREDVSDPLRHVGSVSAPDAETAREQATTLFDWTAEALWLCPADAVERFSARTLGGER
jgi:rSAM-partnered protein